jgi:RNA polymerase sigma-70 factor, ECF subfamily
MSSPLARGSLAPVMDVPGPRSDTGVDPSTLERAARRGDPAQREACRRILGQVYKVVAAVLGPRSPDAGDVAQDVFIRVYNNLHKFTADPDRPSGAAAWVNKIALRVALDHRAGQQRWEPIEEDGPAPGSAAGPTEEEESSALHRTTLVHAMLGVLDERHRAILILFYWNGETQEEIAETLSLPLGTVKTRMRAAHEKIREYVQRG